MPTPTAINQELRATVAKSKNYRGAVKAQYQRRAASLQEQLDAIVASGGRPAGRPEVHEQGWYNLKAKLTRPGSGSGRPSRARVIEDLQILGISYDDDHSTSELNDLLKVERAAAYAKFVRVDGTPDHE